ncbi:hypothetical protein [Chryseobacterium sp.]|uniref:hypothetical protein n=1 Tax=Chryseobacterium sp. TaxID=1871047 RepID=UPI002898AA27|nr:hypothetical protein [Chryseobacterium sp.]
MIKKTSIIGLLFVYMFSYSQKIVDDFNGDNIKDTLNYKCYRVGEIENIFDPTCKIKLRLGKTNKLYNFNLSYISYPVITNCGKGCISLYDDAKDTEYTQEYHYSKKYDDWILTLDETLYNYQKGKIESNLSKNYKLGISGKKYRNSK